MSDFTDDASDVEEIHRQIALKNRRPVPPPSGFCLCCDAAIPRGVFCSSDCRDGFERHAKIRRIQGK